MNLIVFKWRAFNIIVSLILNFKTTYLSRWICFFILICVHQIRFVNIFGKFRCERQIYRRCVIFFVWRFQLLRTCLRISINILFYQRKFTSKLMKIWRTLFIKHFNLHVNICFLNTRFTLIMKIKNSKFKRKKYSLIIKNDFVSKKLFLKIFVSNFVINKWFIQLFWLKLT